jgi:hypothetical protein
MLMAVCLVLTSAGAVCERVCVGAQELEVATAWELLQACVQHHRQWAAPPSLRQMLQALLHPDGKPPTAAAALVW